MPRRLSDATTSSSGGSPAAFAVKPEPQDTAGESPLGRRTRSGALTIPEEGRGGRLCLVRPKTEPEPPLLPVKSKHLVMAAADETAMR